MVDLHASNFTVLGHSFHISRTVEVTALRAAKEHTIKYLWHFEGPERRINCTEGDISPTLIRTSLSQTCFTPCPHTLVEQFFVPQLGIPCRKALRTAYKRLLLDYGACLVDLRSQSPRLQ